MHSKSVTYSAIALTLGVGFTNPACAQTDAVDGTVGGVTGAIEGAMKSVTYTAGQESEWQLFGFDESGFVFEVPPGFEMSQTAVEGQGVMFDGPNGALLAVWGAELAKEDFKAQISTQMAHDSEEGWGFSYIRVKPDWASYSGIKNEQIRYFRAITVCDDRAAVFLFDYPRSEKLVYDPIVVRLVRSFEAEDC